MKLGRGTGFDVDDSDLLEMENCRGVVVASAIFGTGHLHGVYLISCNLLLINVGDIFLTRGI